MPVGTIASARRRGGAPATSSNKWRLLTTATRTAGNTTAVQEIEWRATVGGTDQFTGGTASASSAASGFPASNAFDDSGSSLWSSDPSQSPIIPTWIQYDKGSSITGDELVIIGYSNEANSPKAVQFQLYDGATWQDFISCTDLGAFGPGGTKYIRKTANEIWLKDLLTNHSGGGTSYTDNRAMMGVRVQATANCVVEAVTAWHRTAVGGQYQAVIYQLDSSNNFVSELAAGPISSAAAAQAVVEPTYRLSSAVTLVSGTKYAIGIRRVDGTNTSNPDCHFFNGFNSYRTAPLTIQDVWTTANKSTPSVGTASAITNGSATVWTIAPIYKQASGTLS